MLAPSTRDCCWGVAGRLLPAALLVACSSAQPPPSDPQPNPGEGVASVDRGGTPSAPIAPSTVVDVPPPPVQVIAEPRAPTPPLRTDPPALLPRLSSAKKVTATIETDLGSLTCDLFQRKAPITVENFVGLATGEKQWKDPRTNRVSHDPAYDGTSFHRIIKGFMIQGGDPKGDGTGEPGFTFEDEVWPGARHDRAGLLCMANRGKNTNGAQFFITDAAAKHLDGGFTIFGECSPLETVHRIASAPTSGSGGTPNTRVGIQRVTITLE